MTAVWGLAAIKLTLSVATFAMLGYLGTTDKRIAGVLLTFPILNGIGILTAGDPLAAANSIYVVVVFNGLLLFVAISFYRILPPLPATASAHVQLIARVATWTVLWVAGALAVVVWRDTLPGPLALLIATCVIAATATAVVWKPLFPSECSALDEPAPLGSKAFLSVWWNSAGFVRIGLFAFCCVLLLVAANFYEPKWVGMLSALPLPGLFAVATLSTMGSDAEFGIIRQTVLWGPVTVVAFNWTFAELIADLPAAASWSGLPLLVLLLGADAALIFWAVSRLAASLDTCTMKRRA
jgi:hypothetical protein